MDWELLMWEALIWELLKWEEMLKWELQLCKEGESQLFVSPTSSCFEVSAGVEKWFNLS